MMALDDKNIVTHANIYAALYLNFNDENLEHMYNSFFNNNLNLMTEDKIREHNFQFLNEILSHNVNIMAVIIEITNTEPHFN